MGLISLLLPTVTGHLRYWKRVSWDVGCPPAEMFEYLSVFITSDKIEHVVWTKQPTAARISLRQTTASLPDEVVWKSVQKDLIYFQVCPTGKTCWQDHITDLASNLLYLNSSFTAISSLQSLLGVLEDHMNEKSRTKIGSLRYSAVEVLVCWASYCWIFDYLFLIILWSDKMWQRAG